MVTTIIAIIFMLGGVFFLIVSCVGLIRLPDFYCRNHAVGKSETLGTILTLLGLIIYNGWALTSFKILFILLFVGIANPTATHAVLQAAFYSGLQPWTLKSKPKPKSLAGEKKVVPGEQDAAGGKAESEVNQP
jgi:multicomponent Na+:H+ antiporter subunit G